MGLLSEIDWLILLGAGAFLLLGPQSGGVLRRLGQLYGRLIHLKNELLGEVSKAAGLPPGSPAGGSIRSVLLGGGAPSAPAPQVAVVPVAVAAAPGTALASIAVLLDPVATNVTVAAFGPGSWSWSTAPTPRLAAVGEERGT